MSHAKDNRHVLSPGPKDRNIAEHCKQFGLSAAEQRKLQKLLGHHAPAHEIQANSSPKPPRFR